MGAFLWSERKDACAKKDITTANDQRQRRGSPIHQSQGSTKQHSSRAVGAARRINRIPICTVTNRRIHSLSCFWMFGILGEHKQILIYVIRQQWYQAWICSSVKVRLQLWRFLCVFAVKWIQIKNMTCCLCTCPSQYSLADWLWCRGEPPFGTCRLDSQLRLFFTGSGACAVAAEERVRLGRLRRSFSATEMKEET